MNFEKIPKKRNILFKRDNNTPEKVFEFEFYDLMYNLLDVINAFEIGGRKPLREPDYREMLGSLKHTYKTFKGNIKYLEEYRK